MAAADDGPEVARAWGGGAIVLVLAAIAAVYFGFVFAEAAKSGTAASWLPAPIAYFTQIAALFPGAAHSATDYRVEGFRCKERAWEEIDVSPWFPIDADNKESRFYRTMHFFGERQHRETLRALDEFIFTHYEHDRVAGAERRQSRPAIGGVRFVRLHIPLGTPGDGEPRYERKPLATFPAEDRKDLYYSPESKREARCKELGAW